MKTDLWYRIDALAKDKGVSLQEMCSATGLDYGCTMNMVADCNSLVAFHRLKKIADYFGVSVDYLNNGKRNMRDGKGIQASARKVSSNLYYCEEETGDDRRYTFFVVIGNLPDSSCDLMVVPTCRDGVTLRSNWMTHSNRIIDFKTNLENNRIRNSPKTEHEALELDAQLIRRWFMMDDDPRVIASAIRCVYKALDLSNLAKDEVFPQSSMGKTKCGVTDA